jgi:hypothetical protein
MLLGCSSRNMSAWQAGPALNRRIHGCQGVVIVDSRAGIVPPVLLGKFDPSTLGASFVGGRALTPSRALGQRPPSHAVVRGRVSVAATGESVFRADVGIEGTTSPASTSRTKRLKWALSSRIPTAFIDMNVVT